MKRLRNSRPCLPPTTSLRLQQSPRLHIANEEQRSVKMPTAVHTTAVHHDDLQCTPLYKSTKSESERAASAGLFAPASEHASRGTLRAVRMGCACSARLQRLPATWNSAALVACACRPSAPRAIRSRLQPTQMLQAAMGRPTMAARQLAAVAQPLQGPVASARPCVPSYAIDHHRSKPSL
jgi:hypothetical protein